MTCFDINRFHLTVMVVWQFASFFGSQMLFPIYSTYVPKWRCTQTNSSATSLMPFTKDCSVYEHCSPDLIQFENEYFYSSALEYGWVCSPSSYLSHFYSQVQFFGVLLGTLSFGTLSDLVGRKPAAVSTLSLGMTTLFLSAWAPSWQVLLCARFVVGLAIGGNMIGVFTLVMEVILPHQRMALRAFCNWGVSRLMMTLVCFALPNWRAASIACAVIALPSLLVVVFIFPESPTWLHSKDRLEDMRNAERWIARVAGQEYVEVHREPLERKEGMLELVRDRTMLRRISVLWVAWFSASVTTYAIDLNSSSISGHLYFNQAVFSILIAISKMLLVMVDTFVPTFSRRNLHQYSQGVVIVAFAALTVLTLLNVQGPAILILNVAGSMFAEYTWDAIYLNAIESMPTHLRASATGSCSLMARVGAVPAPFLNYLNAFWPPTVYATVMGLGTMNLLISYTWMVETKGIDLDVVRLHGERRKGGGADGKEMHEMVEGKELDEK